MTDTFLSADLYGAACALSAERYVQDAPTVDEMIARSRVPRHLWYKPEVEVKVEPVVDPEVAAAIAARLLALRTARHLGRAPFATDVIGMAPGMLWRLENGGVKHAELAGIERSLARLESEERR